MRLSAAIIDDEEVARENLASLINLYCPSIQVEQSFGSAAEALGFFAKDEVDIIFMDIIMPEMNGFELLESISVNQQKVIIVSAHSDYGIKAVKAGAFDYLLKPVDVRELRSLALKLEKDKSDQGAATEGSGTSEKPEHLSIRLNDGYKIIEIADIVHVASDNSYCEIYLNQGEKLTVTKSLRDFETLLPDAKFIRVHNSHIINLDFLDIISTSGLLRITLTNGCKVPISRRRLDYVKQRISDSFTSLD